MTTENERNIREGRLGMSSDSYINSYLTNQATSEDMEDIDELFNEIKSSESNLTDESNRTDTTGKTPEEEAEIFEDDYMEKIKVEAERTKQLELERLKEEIKQEVIREADNKLKSKGISLDWNGDNQVTDEVPIEQQTNEELVKNIKSKSEELVNYQPIKSNLEREEIMRQLEEEDLDEFELILKKPTKSIETQETQSTSAQEPQEQIKEPHREIQETKSPIETKEKIQETIEIERELDFGFGEDGEIKEVIKPTIPTPQVKVEKPIETSKPNIEPTEKAEVEVRQEVTETLSPIKQSNQSDDNTKKSAVDELIDNIRNKVSGTMPKPIRIQTTGDTSGVINEITGEPIYKIEDIVNMSNEELEGKLGNNFEEIIKKILDDSDVIDLSTKEMIMSFVRDGDKPKNIVNLVAGMIMQ